jgi:diaminopimelate decarboxylase
VRTHPAGPRSGELHTDRPGQGAPPDLNRLDPQVWPRNATRNRAGAVSLAGLLTYNAIIKRKQEK